jgi:predicted GNAT family N-acyltransferase
MMVFIPLLRCDRLFFDSFLAHCPFDVNSKTLSPIPWVLVKLQNAMETFGRGEDLHMGAPQLHILPDLTSLPDAELEDRSTYRRSVYRSENFKVTAKFSGGSAQGEVVDYTPLGVGFTTAEPLENLPFRIGDLIKLTFTPGTGEAFEAEGVVTNRAETLWQNKSASRIGVAFYSPERFWSAEDDSRGSRRFPCPEFFAPVCYCEHPFLFMERIHFQVMDFSSAGATLLTSARNKGVFPNLRLSLKLMLPTQGMFDVEMEIKHVRSSENGERYVCGAEFIDPDNKTLAAISEYLLNASPELSLAKLRASNFLIETVEHAITCDYAISPSEFESVLQLRFSVAKNLGFLTEKSDHNATLDRFDSYARQATCRMGGKTIACARVVFVEGSKERCEIEEHIKLPDWVWQTPFVEVSRTCIHPEYRGSDVFCFLLRHIFNIANQADAHRIIMDCRSELRPMYKAFGFHEMGIEFRNPQLQQCLFHVMYFDVKSAIRGKGPRIFIWGGLLQPILNHLHSREIIKLSIWARATFKLLSLLHPLLQRFANLARSRRQLKKA